jgi:hypothetical protein
MPEIKIDLVACANLYGYVVVGDDSYGAVDLEFRSLMSASAFVSANEIENRTTITFPDRVSSFGHPITITIRNYAEVFRPLAWIAECDGCWERREVKSITAVNEVEQTIITATSCDACIVNLKNEGYTVTVK